MKLIRFTKYLMSRSLEQALSIKYRVNDVTIIRGLSKGEPYFFIEGHKVNLELRSILQQVEFPNKQQATFMNKNFQIYHYTVPVSLVLFQTFYVKFRGYLYCILNNEPLVHMSHSEQFQNTMAASQLQPILRSSLKDLSKHQPGELITNKSLNNILLKNIMIQAEVLKIEKLRLKELLKVVDRQLETFNSQISEINVLIQRNANRKVRRFTSFVIMQAGIINYLIYFHFSWDIMQPIVNILGTFSAMVAYIFFGMKGKQFSFQQMHESSIEIQKENFYTKYNFKGHKYDQLSQIKQYLTFRYNFMTKSQNVLFDQLEKDFVMLDTR